MQSMLTIQSFIWVVMAATVGSLALYRKFVTRGEVDLVHLGEGGANQIPVQEGLVHQLASIDRWGKILTVVLIAYGVVIACGYMYIAWGATYQIAK
jgi:hypothetical protein